MSEHGSISAEMVKKPFETTCRKKYIFNKVLELDNAHTILVTERWYLMQQIRGLKTTRSWRGAIQLFESFIQKLLLIDSRLPRNSYCVTYVKPIQPFAKGYKLQS